MGLDGVGWNGIERNGPYMLVLTSWFWQTVAYRLVHSPHSPTLLYCSTNLLYYYTTLLYYNTYNTTILHSRADSQSQGRPRLGAGERGGPYASREGEVRCSAPTALLRSATLCMACLLPVACWPAMPAACCLLRLLPATCCLLPAACCVRCSVGPSASLNSLHPAARRR